MALNIGQYGIERRAMDGTSAALLDRAERTTGLPARHAVPALLAGTALQVAVLGMYWDVGYHVDHGRDDQVFTVPHLLIVVGLQLIAVSALLHGVLRRAGGRGDVPIRALRLRLSPGGVVMLACGSVALIGFPLDAIWHALFGEDVTLWGPTHLLMIGGAGLSTLGLWMLVRQGLELGRPRRTAHRPPRARGRRPAHRPVDLPGRVRLRRPAVPAPLPAGAHRARGRLGARLRAVAARALRRVPRARHVPRDPRRARARRRPGRGLHDAALPAIRRRGGDRRAGGARARAAPARVRADRRRRHRDVRRRGRVRLEPRVDGAPVAGADAAAAMALALLAGMGGAVLGARIAQALALEPGERAALAPLPGAAAALAAPAVLVALAVPLPRTGGDGTRAALGPRPAGRGAVGLAVRLHPPGAARRAQWFEVLSWQGRTPGRTRQIAGVRPARRGGLVADPPIPPGGHREAVGRPARGAHLMGLPVYLPPSPQSGRPGVPVAARAGAMRADTFLLQREATGGPRWLEATAYAALAAIVAVWLALVAGALRRAEPPREAAVARDTLRRAWPPAAPV